MDEIDRMDAVAYLRVMAWGAGGGEQTASIDEIGVFRTGVV